MLWIVIHNAYKRYYRNQQQQLLQKSQEQLALKELETSQKFMQLTNEKLNLISKVKIESWQFLQ